MLFSHQGPTISDPQMTLGRRCESSWSGYLYMIYQTMYHSGEKFVGVLRCQFKPSSSAPSFVIFHGRTFHLQLEMFSFHQAPLYVTWQNYVKIYTKNLFLYVENFNDDSISNCSQFKKNHDIIFDAINSKPVTETKFSIKSIMNSCQ